MNLLIDSGNTLTKIAVFDNNKLINLSHFNLLEIKDIIKLKNKSPELDYCILSTVATIKKAVLKYLKNNFNIFINLNYKTKIPVANQYNTKTTLGSDRIALITGANNIYPDTNVLVIDVGSAITYDFINYKNQYLGGNISPGLSMRFKALNKFTKKLPLLSKDENYFLISDNTKDAIISGVQNGIIFEMQGYISKYKKQFKNIKIILSGGDASFFENKLKNTIFAEPNLIFYGLNRILEYNANN